MLVAEAANVTTLTTLWAVVVALSLHGCSEAASGRPETSPGGAAGVGGVGGQNAAPASGGSSGIGGGGAPASSCEGAVPPIRERSGRIDLPIELTIGDVSAVTGMAAAMPDGRELQLSLLKLFLTQPVLIDAQGGEAPGQIVGEDGQPLPYGIQLVDLAAPPSRSWRISVANGSYTRFRFGVGIPQGCNSAATTNLYPLNPDSEMYWSWGAQFMFVRIEGAARSAPQSELESFFYHVGFEGGFARVTVDGTLNVNGISSGPTLVLDVARMLAAEAGSTPAPQQHAVPDGWVADNLERTGTFSFR